MMDQIVLPVRDFLKSAVRQAGLLFLPGIQEPLTHIRRFLTRLRLAGVTSVLALSCMACQTIGAETTKTVFNPFTWKLDYITSLSNVSANMIFNLGTAQTLTPLSLYWQGTYNFFGAHVVNVAGIRADRFAYNGGTGAPAGDLILSASDVNGPVTVDLLRLSATAGTLPTSALPHNIYFGDPAYTVPVALNFSTLVGTTTITYDLTQITVSTSVVITGNLSSTLGTINPSKVLTQLQAIAPSSLGIAYYCSDCTTDVLCVSTGTATGSFARVSARTTVCN